MSSEAPKTEEKKVTDNTGSTTGSNWMSGGTNTSGTTSGFQNVGPSGMAAGYIPGVYALGANALARRQSMAGPTDFTAGGTGGQLAGIQSMYNVAPGLSAGATPLQDMATRISRGEFLDPTNDPTFRGAVNAAITPATQNFTEKVMPNVIGGSIAASGAGSGAGAYGGSANTIPQETLMRDFNKSVMDTTAAMANSSRMAGMNLIPQAGGMFNTANALSLAPSQAMVTGGTLEQQLRQNELTNQLQRYQFGQGQAGAGIDDFLRQLTTGGFTSGTTGQTTAGTTDTSMAGGSQSATTSHGTEDTTKIGPKPNMLAQILQGALGAAGIGASLFGAPVGGTSAVSGLMGLLKGFSGGGGG